MDESESISMVLMRFALALEEASNQELSLASLRALLFIAAATGETDNPNAPSASDIADALKMTISGASRLLSALSAEKAAWVIRDKQLSRGRQDLFFLAPRGKELIDSIVTRCAGGDVVKDRFYHDSRTYAKARFLDTFSHPQIKPIIFDTDRLKITCFNVGETLIDAIREWKAVNDLEIAIERPTFTDHMWFVFKDRAVFNRFAMRFCALHKVLTMP